MISGKRPARSLCAIVAAVVTVIGVSGVGATPAFAAARTGLASPNGPTVSLQFTAGGQVGTVTVQGLTGEQLTVATSAGTFAANCGLQLTLVSPSGSTVTGPQCAGQSGSVASASLPSSGLYKASFVAGAGATGTVTVAATSSGGPASITSGAAALSVSVTAANQDLQLGFSGVAGQNYIATTASGTLPDCNLSLRILDSSGNPVGSSVDPCAGTSGFADARITKKATYSVQLLHNGTVESGTVAVTLSSVTDTTGTVTLDGTPTPVSIATAGVNGEYTFAGTTGQRVAAELTSSTFSGCPAVALALLRPDGTQLGSPASTCSGTGFLDTQALDQTGTWTVLVDPQGAATGTATDQTGTIIRNGTPVNVDLSTPGQNAALTFTGSVGQVVSAQLTGAAFAPGCPDVALAFVRPDGSHDTSVTTCTNTAFLDAVDIDQAGTWTVLVDPQGAATGTATVQAFNANDQKGLIALNGTAVNVSVTTIGQDSSWHFSGSIGQKIAALVTNATFPGCPAFVLHLVRPDGSDLGSVNSCNDTAFLDGLTLDQTGTWVVVVDPQGTATGTATLQAYDATDQTKPIRLNGPTVNISLTQPGENAALTFAGSIGQAVSAQVTAATFTGCPAYQVSLVRPDGSAFGNTTSSCTDSVLLDTQSLDQTGTWTIVVDPVGTATGTAKVQAFESGDQVLPITLNGAPDAVNLGPGQQGFYTFTGAIGQLVSAQVTSSTFSGCSAFLLSLIRPDNSQLGASVSSCNATAFFDRTTLDQDGTWSFLFQPQGSAGGSASLQAYTFTDQTGPVADLAGKDLKLLFGKPGQNASITFAGTSGHRISAFVSSSTLTGCPALNLSLVRPNGTTLVGPVSSCTDNAFVDATTLDATGTWTVFIDPQGPATGQANLQTYSVVDVNPALKPNGPFKSFTTTVRGLNAHFRFAGKVGDSRTVTISGSTFNGFGCPGLVVSFVRPNGSVLSTTSTCNTNLVLGPSVLDGAGTWTIFVDPQGPAEGTLIIRLT